MSAKRPAWETMKPKIPKKKYPTKKKKKKATRTKPDPSAPPEYDPHDQTVIGRPTKLTPELSQKIIAIIRNGNYRKTAAIFCGIAPETLSRWLDRDEEPFLSFRQQVIVAEAEAEVEQILEITRSKDNRDRRWWLERKFPERWGRQVDVSLHGHLDGRLKVDERTELQFSDAQLGDPEVSRLIDELEKRLHLRPSSHDEPDEDENIIVPTASELLGENLLEHHPKGPTGTSEGEAASSSEVS